MNRRSVTQGLAATLLSGAVSGCAGRSHVRAFYACEMDIEIDARTYTLKNGGELWIWEGSYPGNSQTQLNWYPFAATMQLPSGEVLAAIPPSPEGGIRAAFKKAGGTSIEFEPPSEFLPFLDASYPETAVPIVYIFDRGNDCRYAECYAMRAALLDGDTRVTSHAVRIKRVEKDARVSASDLLPWLKSVENVSPKLARSAPGGGVTGVSQMPWGIDGVVIEGPRLGAFSMLLQSTDGSAPFAVTDRKFKSLNLAMAAKQRPNVWIQLEQSTPPGRRFTCSDPRVGVFRQEWADSEVDLLPPRDELLIGGVSLVRDDKCFVCSGDQMTKMLVGRRTLLPNILDGRSPTPMASFGGWHSILSPDSGGFASVLIDWDRHP